MKYSKQKAFTMAEAILVMTILGIIATILITTIKPANFKQKAYKVLAKKVLSQIDTATTQIQLNDTKLGNFKYIIDPDTKAVYDYNEKVVHLNQEYAVVLTKLYKKYLTTLRTPCDNRELCRCAPQMQGNILSGQGFILKDGSCVGFIVYPAQYTIFPGEKELKPVTKDAVYIMFDVNNTKEPNKEGEDIFIVPFGIDGIEY